MSIHVCCHYCLRTACKAELDPTHPSESRTAEAVLTKGPITSALRYECKSSVLIEPSAIAGGIVDPSHGAREEKTTTKWFQS